MINRSIIKGDLLCAFFTICNISPRCLQNVSVKFQLKYPTDHLLYHFENACFGWKQKRSVSVHVSLNANELLLPAPFSKSGLCLHSSDTLLICLVRIIVYHAEIMRFKLYECKLLMYGFPSAHIRSERTQSDASKLFHVVLHLNCQIHTSLC